MSVFQDTLEKQGMHSHSICCSITCFISIYLKFQEDILINILKICCVNKMSCKKGSVLLIIMHIFNTCSALIETSGLHWNLNGSLIIHSFRYMDRKSKIYLQEITKIHAHYCCDNSLYCMSDNRSIKLVELEI